MSDRREILERVRKALGHASQGPVPPPARSDAGPPESPLPPIAPEELVPRFELEWRKVGGSASRAASLEELEASIREILDAAKATSVVLSRNPLLAQLGLGDKLLALGKSVVIWPSLGASLAEGNSLAKDEAVSRRDFKAASFSAAVGITGVDFALAESGSLVLSSRTEGSQLSSLAPPIHVALYRRGQAVGSLEEVLERLPISREAGTPAPGRSVVFITGPSRTADIEQILVRGVHGPREVHAILVEESCLV